MSRKHTKSRNGLLSHEIFQLLEIMAREGALAHIASGPIANFNCEQIEKALSYAHALGFIEPHPCSTSPNKGMH